MRRDPSDIDRLIEEGLDRYAAGDIDGALLAWDRALELDPENAQASSYVEYVRANYDILMSTEIALDDLSAPFAIREEPEYEIEISPGELEPGEPAPMFMDPRDTGWAIEDEAERSGADAPIELELVAEEPPGVSFDDRTQEYTEAQRQARDDFAAPESPTTEFRSEESTGGFSTQTTTDVKQRNLGFVQPAGEGSNEEPPPMPKITVRTPGADKTTGPLAKATTAEIAPKPVVDDDLIGSLPSPRPVGTSPVGEVALGAVSTKEFAGIPTAKLPGLGAAEDPVVGVPTRDLGIKPPVGGKRPGTMEEEEPTTESNVQALRAAVGTQTELATPFDAIDAKAARILDDVDASAPADESREDRTRRRITDLVERALAWSGISELEKAAIAVELAFSEDPNSALAQKLLHRNRETIMNVFQLYLGDLDRQPQLARPLHELAHAPISSRAAFLLSRIDGTLSLDEILDVSGMPRLEAYRHLCQLFLRGILR